MNNSFLSPLPTFTLESLVTNGQWAAAQNIRAKKTSEKASAGKKNELNSAQSSKTSKPAL
jgi:squalene cyclase